jgi:RNA polymerase sigma-70 factor (ECF subfamily)
VTARERDDLVRVLYAEHGRRLTEFVASLVAGDRHRAEDLVQETMLRAWRHADELLPLDRSPRPWLFTVARRLVIDAHRAREARPREVDTEVLDLVPATDELERVLVRAPVRQALAQLQPAHREVLVHLHYLRYSVAETAQALGIPAGTVKSRSYYAVQALRVALEAQGIGA